MDDSVVQPDGLGEMPAPAVSAENAPQAPAEEGSSGTETASVQSTEVASHVPVVESLPPEPVEAMAPMAVAEPFIESPVLSAPAVPTAVPAAPALPSADAAAMNTIEEAVRKVEGPAPAAIVPPQPVLPPDMVMIETKAAVPAASDEPPVRLGRARPRAPLPEPGEEPLMQVETKP